MLFFLANTVNESFKNKNIGFCQQDSDCILVQQELNCCLSCGVKAINVNGKKYHEKEYNERCSGKNDVVCPLVSCDNNKQKQAICEQNICIAKEISVNNNANSNNSNTLTNANNTEVSSDEKQQIARIFQTFLEAEKNCDIDSANSIITEQSKKIMRYSCSSMKAERECYASKDFEIVGKKDNAVLYFTPFSTDDAWPLFFAKENNQWKIDFAKMAGGITMEGGGCNTGWHWRNLDLKDEFCSYFSDGQCPIEIIKILNQCGGYDHKKCPAGYFCELISNSDIGVCKLNIDDINIKTDKTNYAIGEIIQIQVESKENIFGGWFNIAKFENSRWPYLNTEEFANCGSVCRDNQTVMIPCADRVLECQQNTKFGWQWTQQYLDSEKQQCGQDFGEYIVSKNAAPGKYKVIFSYSKNSNCNKDVKTIEQEFMIQ